LAGAYFKCSWEYAVPAITPIFLETSLLSLPLWFFASFAPAQAKTAVAWGVFFGGFDSAAVSSAVFGEAAIVCNAKVGFSPIPALSVFCFLMGPALFGVVGQSNNFYWIQLLASFLTKTAVSRWLYLVGSLFIELPLGHFAIAISTVIFCLLCRVVFLGVESTKFSDTLALGRCVFYINCLFRSSSCSFYVG